ncbi:MAG: hypothetical protein Q9225_006208 [Loekoesia sp. 1 TL-2023]
MADLELDKDNFANETNDTPGKRLKASSFHVADNSLDLRNIKDLQILRGRTERAMEYFKNTPGSRWFAEQIFDKYVAACKPLEVYTKYWSKPGYSIRNDVHIEMKASFLECPLLTVYGHLIRIDNLIGNLQKTQDGHQEASTAQSRQDARVEKKTELPEQCQTRETVPEPSSDLQARKEGPHKCVLGATHSEGPGADNHTFFGDAECGSWNMVEATEDGYDCFTIEGGPESSLRTPSGSGKQWEDNSGWDLCG